MDFQTFISNMRQGMYDGQPVVIYGDNVYNMEEIKAIVAGKIPQDPEQMDFREFFDPDNAVTNVLGHRYRKISVSIAEPKITPPPYQNYLNLRKSRY